MRSIAHALVALCLVTVAHAAPNVDLDLPPPKLIAPVVAPGTRLELERREHSARALRNAGIATTVVGTAVNLVGVGLVMTSLCYDSGCHHQDSLAAGFGLIGVGYGGVFAGIPMWAVGGTRLKHAKAELALTAAGLVGRF